MTRITTFALIGSLALLLAAAPSLARDVAFVEPGMGGGSATPDEAFKIEPKSEIDIGDSIINIVRRQTLFFVNQTSAPIKIEKVTLSSDSTVAAVIANDDCSKQGTIPPLSRCSLELSITPTGPGAWAIELLMTHNGAGRITRAKISGKTAGSDGNDKRDRGLFLSTKDSKPIDFGEVTVGQGKVVRSALMVNDSTSPITLYSIDVIEADKSLQRLDQGCSADMDLKPGESCPVTMVWTPTSHGFISTDLIIRHSGQLGFAVVPIRGSAKQGEGDSKAQTMSGASSDALKSALPLPPSAADVAKEMTKAVAPMPEASLSTQNAATGYVHLIGTVGNRAVLLKPDGSTAIVQSGETFDMGGGTAKVDSVGAQSATLTINGKPRKLALEAVQELKDKANASRLERDSSKDFNVSGGSGGDSGHGFDGSEAR